MTCQNTPQETLGLLKLYIFSNDIHGQVFFNWQHHVATHNSSVEGPIKCCDGNSRWTLETMNNACTTIHLYCWLQVTGGRAYIIKKYFDKFNFLFLVTSGSQFHRSSNHSVYITSTQWFHHPGFYYLVPLVVFWSVLASMMPFAASTKLDLGHHLFSSWIFKTTI